MTSNALQDEIRGLVGLTTTAERESYLAANPILAEVESARAICRTAVSLLYTDPRESRRCCEFLDVVAEKEPNSLTLGYREHAWGALTFYSGFDQEAVDHWQKAIAHFEAADREDEVAITCSNALKALVRIGRVDLFHEWTNRAKALFEKTRDNQRLTRLLANAAVLHERREEWRPAAEAYSLALAQSVKNGAPSRDIWVNLTSLGVCYTLQGDLPHALLMFEKARLKAEEAGLTSALSQTQLNVAHVKYLQGDFGGALQMASRAKSTLALHGRVDGSRQSALTEADALLCLGLTSEAEERASEALALFEALGLKHEQGQASMVLGHCARLRARFGAALEFYARARSFFEETLSVRSVLDAELHEAMSTFLSGGLDRALAMVRALLESMAADQSNEVRIAALVLRSKIELELGQPGPALESVEAALATLIPLDRTLMEMDALHQFGRVHEKLGNFEMAYSAYINAERHITHLRGRLSEKELRTGFLSDKTLLYEDVFWLSMQLQLPAHELLAFAEKAKSRALAEWMTQEPVENQGLHTTPRPGTDCVPSRDTVTDALGDNTALVEYYFARGQIFAFCVAGRDCQILRLGDVRLVERLHRLVRFHVHSRPSTDTEDMESTAPLLHYLRALYEQLWMGLRDVVIQRNVVVVPHGFLHHCPFHLLFDGGQFLADHHVISYAPSCSVFVNTCRPAPRPSSSGSIVVGLSDALAPRIASEARDIAALLPDARLFLNGEASKARLLSEFPAARLIHIAAHGAFSSRDPDFSALTIDDDRLSVKDFEALRLGAQLVVLSGCETGRSATRGADEIVGLTQALLQAGARSALVSLWSVDDESTAAFMRHFYAQLLQTTNRAEALREAQALHRENYSHPFFWAPFVLVGAPS